MNSQTQRGYKHGASRGSAYGGAYPFQEPSARGRGSRGNHFLSPNSASDYFWDTNADTGYGPTASPSPSSQYTPDLVLNKAERDSEEEEELESTSSEEEEEDAIEGTEKTGAELLAEKRKMKRFRLTHAQTRYLMSEFARQSHPDSGQREKLSRDIPGLSPRQVQVWFQNRRAKLKRLTADDQEHMMKSRALPDNFDFAQTLQSGTRDDRSRVDSAVSHANPNLRGGAMPRNATLSPDSDQRNLLASSTASVYDKSPSSIGSAVRTGSLSRASSINEGSHYSGSGIPEAQSPVAANYYSHPLRVDLQTQPQQAELFRQRGSSLAQSTSVFASSTSAYQEYGALSSARAGPQSRNTIQNTATFPRLETPNPVHSPPAAPNMLCYGQRQMNYPQNAAGPGYYQASSFSQSFELSGAQGGQMVPENLRYDPRNSPLGTPQQPSNSQSSPRSYVNDQLTTYQHPVYEELGQQHIPSPFVASPNPGPATNPNPNTMRQRGNTFPNFYTHHR